MKPVDIHTVILHVGGLVPPESDSLRDARVGGPMNGLHLIVPFIDQVIYPVFILANVSVDFWSTVASRTPWSTATGASIGQPRQHKGIYSGPVPVPVCMI